MNKHSKQSRKIGKIVMPLGVVVQKHEKLVADFMAVSQGWNIIFLQPDRTIGSKTPDISMNGIKWEIKSPKGKSSRTIENNLRAALLQSPNIILDLRRMDRRVPADKHFREVKRQFDLVKSIKRLIVISLDETLHHFTK